jgi:uncharacterized iron-regulated protein
MLLRIALFFTLPLFALVAQAQDFELYDSTGKPVKFKKAVKVAGKADVVLFGELHDDSTCHVQQLEFLRALVNSGKTVVFGAEMLEADGQTILDEYTTGLISEKYFKREARLWPNYDTDYAPMVNYAKEQGLKVVATNVPRRYASTVAAEGPQVLTAFPDAAKARMAPLPYPFDSAAPGYAEMMQMNFGHGGNMAKTNMVQAQALKDATMAHFIGLNMVRKGLFFHIQGDFHSANRGGIGWYLREYDITEDIVVISTVRAESTEWNPEWSDRGDFILVTREIAEK